MKLILKKTQLELSPDLFIRRAGYGQIRDRLSGQTSYVRRFTRDFYPRLHLYIELRKNDSSNDELVIFNLHLDQKKPAYAGQTRHNAEYDGPVVAKEIERIKSLALN